MNWSNLAKWKKYYILISFVVLVIVITIGEIFYTGSSLKNNYIQSAFIWGISALFYEIFIYALIDFILSLKEFKNKNGKLNFSYVSRKAFRLFITLLVVYYIVSLVGLFMY